VLSQSVAAAAHDPVVTTHVGTGTAFEQPPAKLIVSVEAAVVQPPDVVAKSSKTSYCGLV